MFCSTCCSRWFPLRFPLLFSSSLHLYTQVSRTAILLPSKVNLWKYEREKSIRWTRTDMKGSGPFFWWQLLSNQAITAALSFECWIMVLAEHLRCFFCLISPAFFIFFNHRLSGSPDNWSSERQKTSPPGDVPELILRKLERLSGAAPEPRGLGQCSQKMRFFSLGLGETVRKSPFSGVKLSGFGFALGQKAGSKYTSCVFCHNWPPNGR